MSKCKDNPDKIHIYQISDEASEYNTTCYKSCKDIPVEDYTFEIDNVCYKQNEINEDDSLKYNF